ncbi:hypothetical protein KCP76_04535 [Salmonella enterica subsp. enterica serovar Weltevreden]|nr:hypothetical protein KCP76_04535 [Salmonella enterica subsp. enterica serovar Weltevreden]
MNYRYSRRYVRRWRRCWSPVPTICRCCANQREHGEIQALLLIPRMVCSVEVRNGLCIGIAQFELAVLPASPIAGLTLLIAPVR